MRDWIVMLHARSSVRFVSDDRVQINASEDSDAPVKSVRVRNAFTTHEDHLLFTGIIGEAWGTANGPDDAVATLVPYASRYLDSVALAGNGCVDEVSRLLVYAPPTDGEPGRFLEQRPCDPWSPAATVRSVGMRDASAVIAGVSSHADTDRVHRAIAHYSDALRHLDPFNRLRSAELLWMAAENLGLVVLRRICRERGLPCVTSAELGESKHLLAIEAGFTPVGKSRQHLYDFDSALRITEIFGGERATYGRLKAASDGLEHGYAAFGEAQSHAEASADAAFGLIRTAILRELGVPADSDLTCTRFAHPQAGWQPVLNVSGVFSSDRDEDWPHFYGAGLVPEIKAIEDISDDRRNVTFQLNASGGSLLDGQTLSIESRRWSLPGTPDRQVEQVGEPEIVFRKADRDHVDPADA